MSLGGWLPKPSVGRSLGVAIALLLAVVIGVGLWLTQPPKPVSRFLEPFNEFFAGIDPECATVLTKPEELARTTPYKIDDCEDKAVAQRKGYRDLDQAIRSANAAENAAWLSLLQTRASVVGAAFLVLTLFATAWAAWAAADAAQVAEKSALAAQQSVEEARKATKFAQVTADAAREALATTDRAWIKIEAELTEPLVFGPETISVGVRFTFRNIGKAPATHVSITASMFADSFAAQAQADNSAKNSALSVMVTQIAGIGVVIFPGDSHVEDNIALEISTISFKDRIAEMNKWGAESSEPYSVTTAFPCILPGAKYVLPGEQRYRFTYLPFEIRGANRRFAGWDGGELRAPIADLALRPGGVSGLVK